MVIPAAFISDACRKVMLPSGPTGTSNRAVSGRFSRERFSTSPGPKVRCSCQRARVPGVAPERERLAPSVAVGLGADSLSAAGKRLAPETTTRRQASHRREEFLFMVPVILVGKYVSRGDPARRRRAGEGCCLRPPRECGGRNSSGIAVMRRLAL